MKTELLCLSGILFFSLVQFHCTSSRYITPASTLRRNVQQQISDQDIQKAFETKPQLVKPITIAVYSGGSPVKGFADSLRHVDGISQVFEISPGLLEGDRYYERRGYRWYPYYDEPVTTDLQRLRLVAAQGKADLLVFCGASHVYRRQTNFLAYTYVLLLTALFVPGWDADLSTDVDLFFIDVRSGYLYGTYHDQETYSKSFVTIYHQDSLDDIKDEHIAKILPRLLSFAKELLAQKNIYLKDNQ
jgi:hypothetical protein